MSTNKPGIGQSLVVLIGDNILNFKTGKIDLSSEFDICIGRVNTSHAQVV